MPGQRRFDGGVHDAAGTLVALGRHGFCEHRSEPAPSVAPAPVRRLAGTWLFGGWLSLHFGHVLNESLGRLWAVDRLGGTPLAGIVFLSYDAGLLARATPVLPAFSEDLIRLAGLTGAIHVTQAQTTIERLIPPEQLALSAATAFA